RPGAVLPPAARLRRRLTAAGRPELEWSHEADRHQPGSAHRHPCRRSPPLRLDRRDLLLDRLLGLPGGSAAARPVASKTATAALRPSVSPRLQRADPPPLVYATEEEGPRATNQPFLKPSLALP